MNTKMRNLTLTAAALAALTVTAPKAAAEPWKNFPLPPSPHEVREMWRERHETPRQEYREHGRGGYGYGHRYGYGHGPVYVAPRPVVRYGYGYAAPYRTYAGFRFYSACPGPGYVYVANYGWARPPFFGAVWVPGYTDIDGFWVEGYWR
ncbi:MAG TPA: hypothetical protein PLB01_10075 [Thermoanaerobaculia bacterium]|nr:hypothetical protein [Thermoanaerobaculia bacterium]